MKCTQINLITFFLLILACSCQVTHNDQDVITQVEKELVIRQITEELQESGYAFNETFQDIDKRIKKHQQMIDTTTTIGAFVRVIKMVLDEYQLSHLWVNTPDQMSVRAKGKNKSSGLNMLRTKQGYFVTRVVEGGVADLGGIRKGDYLLAIDGDTLQSKDQLKSEASQNHVIKVKRKDSICYRTLHYFEHPIFSKDSLYFLNEDIAVININTFRKGVYDRSHIEAMFSDAAETKRIILDMRSNGGGLYTNVLHLLSMIIPLDEVCMYFVYREDHDDFLAKYDRFPASIKEIIVYNGRESKPRRNWMSWLGKESAIYKGEIMVVIDGNNGSGGDMFPICVQDVKRGKVIGTKSLGKVLFGERKSLAKGMSLLYPTGEAVRLNGERLEGNGCIPDIRLTREETANDLFIQEFVRNYELKDEK